MATRRATKKATAKKATAKKATHKHRPPGTKKKRKRQASVAGLLDTIGSKPTSPAKKGKHIIELEGEEARSVFGLLVKKNDLKNLKDTVSKMEQDVLPMLEERRLAINSVENDYVGSVVVSGKGIDDDGNEFDTGHAIYYIQNRYSGFDPTVPSTDEELQTVYDGEATLRDEAVDAIIHTMADFDPFFDEDEEDFDYDEAADKAEEMLNSRMDISYSISLKEGALAVDADGNPVNPEVVEILQTHLADWLEKRVRMKPNESFHKKSNYDPKERAIMQTLDGLRLMGRSKAVLKPDTSQKKKAKPGVAKRRVKKR